MRFNGEVKGVRERLIKGLLDLTIISVLLNCGALSGYRLIEKIYEHTGVFVAPSALYPTLHAMVKRRLVKRVPGDGKGSLFMATSEGAHWAFKAIVELGEATHLLRAITSCAGKNEEASPLI